MSRTLHLTGDAEADALLSEDWLALLLGMLLDQQVPMEWAFAGPHRLAERIGGLDAGKIATMDPDELAKACTGPPAVHRFPGSMSKRIQNLCIALVDDYNGRPEAIWFDDEPDGKEVLRRLKALPGFGEQKAKIFLALLAKQCGVEPTGWQEVTGDYGATGAYRSVADVVDESSLQQVRSFKKEMKAAAKAAKK